MSSSLRIPHGTRGPPCRIERTDLIGFDPDDRPPRAPQMHNSRPAPLRPSLWSLVALGCLGCATLGEQGQPLVPTRCVTRTGPYAVYSSFPLKPEAPAIRSLHSLERDIEVNLGIHVRGEEPSVQVYILN